MTAPTFIQVLKAEVARMQALHPERDGEIARAHALILALQPQLEENLR